MQFSVELVGTKRGEIRHPMTAQPDGNLRRRGKRNAKENYSKSVYARLRPNKRQTPLFADKLGIECKFVVQNDLELKTIMSSRWGSNFTVITGKAH